MDCAPADRLSPRLLVPYIYVHFFGPRRIASADFPALSAPHGAKPAVGHQSGANQGKAFGDGQNQPYASSVAGAIPLLTPDRRQKIRRCSIPTGLLHRHNDIRQGLQTPGNFVETAEQIHHGHEFAQFRIAHAHGRQRGRIGTYAIVASIGRRYGGVRTAQINVALQLSH